MIGMSMVNRPFLFVAQNWQMRPTYYNSLKALQFSNFHSNICEIDFSETTFYPESMPFFFAFLFNCISPLYFLTFCRPYITPLKTKSENS
jgi:hypothetical protein